MLKATMPDIAKRAGVSIATVSRVINNYPFIKESTRKKVLDAIEEFNYFPDLIARSMKKRRTYNIGLIVGELSNPFFAETAEEIVRAVKRHDCHVTLCVTEEPPKDINEHIDFLITMRVDGLIIGSIFKDDPITRLRDSKIPYVFYNRTNGYEGADFIIQDNKKGAFDAVAHLIRLGHTRIGLLHGPLGLSTAEGRIAGYYEALNSYKIKIYPHFIRGVDYEDVETKVALVIPKMFEGKVKPSAIFATADFLALDAMEVLSRSGYRIPEDIALVGFDNLRISGNSLIGLTTVGYRAKEMARLASERLMQMIENRENNKEAALAPWKIVLQPELVVRRSCGSELNITARG